MKNRTNTCLLISIVLLLAISCNSKNQKMPLKEVNLEEFSNDIDGIEKLIEWYFNTYEIPSLSVGIIQEKQVLAFISKGVEEGNLNNTVETNQNTLYQIASLSKMFTGIICNSLEKQGKIDINESVIKYLPAINNKKIIKKLKPIKVVDLLLHTSGLPQRANNLERYPNLWYVVNGYSKEKLYKDIEESELMFEVGSKWSYSNLGYALLCHILENVTNMKYEELLQQYVSTEYNLPVTKTQLVEKDKIHLATPYVPEKKNVKTKPSDFGLHVAASGIYSSTQDLTSLMIKQLKIYESSDSIKLNHPLFLTNQKANIWKNVYYGYGLGEVKGTSKNNKPTQYNHSGDFDGYASHYKFFPELQLGIVILTSKGGPWFSDLQDNMEMKLLETFKR